jgi:hypothetical protein
MRTVDESEMPEDYENLPGVEMADWKESVDEVLKSIDKQLKPFGLEVVEIDTGSDTYAWYIEKIKPQKGKK